MTLVTMASPNSQNYWSPKNKGDIHAQHTKYPKEQTVLHKESEQRHCTAAAHFPALAATRLSNFALPPALSERLLRYHPDWFFLLPSSLLMVGKVLIL